MGSCPPINIFPLNQINWKQCLLFLLWFSVLLEFVLLSAITNRMRGGNHPSYWFNFEETHCQSLKCRNSWGILLHEGCPRWICGIGYGIIILIFINSKHNNKNILWIFITLSIFCIIVMIIGARSDVNNSVTWIAFALEIFAVFITLLTINFKDIKNTINIKNIFNSIFLKLFLMFFALVLISLSLYVGWGCYFTIGRNPNAYYSRWGVFDLIVGRDEKYFNFNNRWLHDICAMCLRGMLQTLPIGLVLYFLSYFTSKNKNNGYKNWEFSLSGIVMGFLYNWSWNIYSTSDNWTGNGTPIAEGLWGAWPCFILIVSLWTYEYDSDLSKYFCCCLNRNNNEDLNVIKNIEIRYYDIMFHLLIWFLLIIFIISCFFYGYGAPRKDSVDFRNWAQSQLGLCISTVASIIIYIWFICYYFIQKSKLNKCQQLIRDNAYLRVNDNDFKNNKIDFKNVECEQQRQENNDENVQRYENNYLREFVLDIFIIKNGSKAWCFIMSLLRLVIITFWVVWFAIFFCVLHYYDRTYVPAPK
eukprot:325804_1